MNIFTTWKFPSTVIINLEDEITANIWWNSCGVDSSEIHFNFVIQLNINSTYLKILLSDIIFVLAFHVQDLLVYWGKVLIEESIHELLKIKRNLTMILIIINKLILCWKCGCVGSMNSQGNALNLPPIQIIIYSDFLWNAITWRCSMCILFVCVY